MKVAKEDEEEEANNTENTENSDSFVNLDGTPSCIPGNFTL